MKSILVELVRICGLSVLAMAGALAYAGFWFGLSALAYWVWPWLALPVGCISFTMVIMVGPVLCETAAAVERRRKP